MIGFILKLLVFGTKGIIKGSLSDLIQSSIIVINAGSIFAKLTSLGMSS